MRFAGLTLAAMLLATSAVAAPFRIIVTGQDTPLVPNSVLHLAESEGYFDRAGVEVELVPTAQTPLAVAALQAGEGEMANISLDALISLHREGVSDILAVHSSDKAIPYVIVAKKGMTLEGLAGAAFGIGRMRSLDHDLSSKVLAARGVNVDTLRLVPLGDPQVRAQALSAGRIDATTMSIGAFLAMPDHDRFEVLVNADDFFATVPLVSKVNVIRAATLQDRPEEVEKVLEALTLAARDYAADPQAWAAAMIRARADVDPAVLVTLADTYRANWTVNGGLQQDELVFSARRTQDAFRRENGEDLPFRVEVEDWAAFGPMDAVLERVGVSDLGDPVSR